MDGLKHDYFKLIVALLDTLGLEYVHLLPLAEYKYTYNKKGYSNRYRSSSRASVVGEVRENGRLKFCRRK